METYIKNNVTDITYTSELTPHPAYGMQALQVNFTAPAVIIPKAGCGVKFALTTYVHCHSVSCGLIKGGAVKWLKKNL